MGRNLERRIAQIGGILMFAVLGLGLAELLGIVDQLTLGEFFVLFLGLGFSMTVLRWWAA